MAFPNLCFRVGDLSKAYIFITLLDFFDTHLKRDQEINESNSLKLRKIWNISLKKWDVIEKDKFSEYMFGKQDGIPK